jgi:GT2 family glycosyltransferase
MQYYAPKGLKPNDHARNSCVQYFLNETDAEYLFFVDHDTIPTFQAPLELLRAGKDIITGFTPVASMDVNTGLVEKWYSVCRFGVAKDGTTGLVPISEGAGIEKVDACGASCLLIHRRVLEAVKFPFRVRFDEDGLSVLGQDFSFCLSALEAGFEVFAHFDVLCGHYKDVMLR